MAIECLGSLQRFSAEAVRLILHDDGSLTDEDEQLLLDSLSASICKREEADECCDAALKAFPHCAQFRRENKLSFKLIDLPLLSGEADLAYSDTDVYFFRPFTGLFAWPDEKTGALFMVDSQSAYALRPWHLMGAIAVPTQLNTGLMLVRRRAFDLDFVEWFLKRDWPAFGRMPLWVEQTCWAALGARMDCRLWNPFQVRVVESERCLRSDLLAGHFTSDVRPLLAKATQFADANRQPESLTTIAPDSLTPWGLAWQQGRRFARRRFGI